MAGCRWHTKSKQGRREAYLVPMLLPARGLRSAQRKRGRGSQWSDEVEVPKGRGDGIASGQMRWGKRVFPGYMG